MAEWGQLEPKEVELLQAAFDKARAQLRIDRDSAEAHEMARYLFKLFASGVTTEAELVTKTVEARPQD